MIYRVRLNKRRTKAKSAMNSKLVVKHRDLTEDEVYAQVLHMYVYLLCRKKMLFLRSCLILTKDQR